MTATKFTFIYSINPGSNGKYLRMDFGWDPEFNPLTSWYGTDSTEHTADAKAHLIATTLSTQGHIVAVGIGYANSNVFSGSNTATAVAVTWPDGAAPASSSEPKATDNTWTPVSVEEAGSMSLADLIALAQQKATMTGGQLPSATNFEDDAEFTAFLIAYVTEGNELIILADPDQ